MQDVGTSKRDNLIADDFPLETDEITIAAEQTLVRGTAIGVITVGGEGAAVDDGAADGREALHAILSEDVTTGVGETKVATIYLTGGFNERAIVFESGTAAAYKTAARALSIFFKSSVPA